MMVQKSCQVRRLIQNQKKPYSSQDAKPDKAEVAGEVLKKYAAECFLRLGDSFIWILKQLEDNPV